MPIILGLDISTQSVTGLIINTDNGSIECNLSINYGNSFEKYNSPQGFIIDETNHNDEVYSNPLMWIDGIELLFNELSKIYDLSKIDALSGAGQQHASIYLNDNWFHIINSFNLNENLSYQIEKCLSFNKSPIWLDKSTSFECKEINDKIGKDNIIKKTGSQMTERFSGAQIRKIYNNNNDVYLNTKRIHLCSSFICSILTGNDSSIDIGDASGMNLLNINNKCWDLDICNAIAPCINDSNDNLINKLPKISNNCKLGNICSYFVEKYGFNNNVLVSIFTGDNPASLVGMGVSQNEGKIVISLGTSDTVFCAVNSIITDSSGSGHVFGNACPSINDGFMSLQCFINGSFARENIKNKFNFTWEKFSDALLNTPSGNNNNIMIPFFTSEISPNNVNITQPILLGTDNFMNWIDVDSICRSCIEGQFMNMKKQIEWMNINYDIIYLTGGASVNNEIAQIVSNIFQVTVKRLELVESVSLGAALRAANICLGIDINILENKFCNNIYGNTIIHDINTAQIYNDLYDKFNILLNKYIK